MTYNPRDYYPKDDIVPSEIDSYFRYAKLQGFVHDMGAAMQGGIGGHAGLFGNSEDIAKMMHLFLSKGKFGETEIFSSSNFDLFNKRHFKGNRRGIGFDKRQLDKETNSACECVSQKVLAIQVLQEHTHGLILMLTLFMFFYQIEHFQPWKTES